MSTALDILSTIVDIVVSSVEVTKGLSQLDVTVRTRSSASRKRSRMSAATSPISRGARIGLPACRCRATISGWNGSNHQHGDIRYQPHIHRATEAAITDGKKPEHAAEETARYQTLEGALACLIEDFSLSGIRANPDQPSLFHGHQS